ncbi:helix-turn-helix domain-containing protein [Saccharomonospora piscinae]|uniref:DNA-binding protein n=1 Tax=Saccharomonospora piscinae TaxID=687388 RepID=A0A1V9A5I8_SACPI|nr:helix-turn-helix domain-containing protein [Saccharomonospora piscinae]OQO92402.1 DNA-binding protein [Saccharomonospora piscinae]
MQTLTSQSVPAEQLDELESYAQNVSGPQLRDLLQTLVQSLRAGAEVVAYPPNATLTPNQAAKLLGMSRTHLYKLLDTHVVPSHRVGRDRRIYMADIAKFDEARQADRRELAERFAARDATRAGAIDELADLL